MQPSGHGKAYIGASQLSIFMDHFIHLSVPRTSDAFFCVLNHSLVYVQCCQIVAHFSQPPMPSTLAQSKERKGSNFAAQRCGAIVLQAQRAKSIRSKNLAIAIWQPCLCWTNAALLGLYSIGQKKNKQTWVEDYLAIYENNDCTFDWGSVWRLQYSHDCTLVWDCLASSVR